MNGDRWRAGRVIAIPALVLLLWLVGAGVITWHGLGSLRGRIVNKLSRFLGKLESSPSPAAQVFDGPSRIDDPRLSALRDAARTWKTSLVSTRIVVDQVCLVPDEQSFLKAIAAWDEHHFFPILIDEPGWTLPFLRAFRPARVIRYRMPQPPQEMHDFHGRPGDPAEALWRESLAAVSQSWSSSRALGRTLEFDALLPPPTVGVVPPGVVLSSPGAPMLAGAVALAAGRFQPLIRLSLALDPRLPADESVRTRGYADVLSLGEAWSFARFVEARVASLIPAYDRLGDACDFLTIADDCPYRYRFDDGPDGVRGLYALDDLIGRRFDMRVRTNWHEQARARWGFTGRLLGDPAASVARAMAALFLQPESTLLWNNYGDDQPWQAYSVDPAARSLAGNEANAQSVSVHAGRQSDLPNWWRTGDPVSRFGSIFVNSAGGPDWFQIRGGPGRPSDIPVGIPTAVAMIHSFSAADPMDPQTIAGRWLAQGAFSYFGSMHEPFLLAFRTPGLVAELMADGLPFVAALRQGEQETFGIPWRLVYLGDPLYRLERSPGQTGKPARRARIDAERWQANAPVNELRSDEVVIVGLPGTRSDRAGAQTESDDERLAACLDAAISELTAPTPGASPRVTPVSIASAHPASSHKPRWREALLNIQREKLAPPTRSRFDALLIDTLEQAGAYDDLLRRLAQIPRDQREPRVWQTLERASTVLFARILDQGHTPKGFVRALDLWDKAVQLDWPEASHFPGQLTERVGALVGDDPHRRQLWLDQLNRSSTILASEPRAQAHAAMIAAEIKRIAAPRAQP